MMLITLSGRRFRLMADTVPRITPMTNPSATATRPISLEYPAYFWMVSSTCRPGKRMDSPRVPSVKIPFRKTRYCS